jgi:replicative superfamily II helicase
VSYSPQLRPEELTEVDELKKRCAIKVKAQVEDTAGKVNVLLQGYLSQERVKSFTLQSDTNYVAQNAGRISRALFEITLKRGWGNMAMQYLAVSQCIDRRIRSDQTPLRQFTQDALPHDVIRRIEEMKIDINQMVDMDPKEVGELCRNQKLGGKILALVNMLPHLDVYAEVQPITRDVIKMNLTLTAAFKWSDRYHGTCEAFWVWVDDGDSETIYHSESFLLMRKQKDEEHKLEFTLPIREPMPPQYYVRVVSDRWVGCQSAITVSFQHLVWLTL